MNVTITGGTGFVGSRLVERLVSDGHRLGILGRSPQTGVHPEVRYHLWAAEKGVLPPESLEGVDAVVHLAGEPISRRWTPEIKRRVRTSRVEGTRGLVAAIRQMERRPRVLVSASAVGYYGDRGDERLTEQSAPGKGFLPEVCAAWEAEADKAAELGIRVVKLRIGLVLGIGGGALAQMLPPFKMFIGGSLGGGRQWMSWIHLDDLVGLIQFALDHPEVSGAVNAVAPNPVRNSQFTRVLARTLRRPALMQVPPQGLRLLFGEMAQLMLDSQKVVPEAAQKAGYQFAYDELAPALKDLLG
jgi:uncharacterized protein (TIGR01777 family)